MEGSYQVYLEQDFLNTDFFNKRIPLLIKDIKDEEKVIAHIKKVYGDFPYKKDGNSIFIEGASFLEAKSFDFSDFVSILKRLMAKDGCEWDRAQTHESIRINLIEEAYELLEAIDKKDKDMMLEESGDVLMQAAFHTQIAEKNGEYNYYEMFTNLCRKLIDRHTHIFGENHATNPEEALKFWNEAKKKEKKYQSTTDAMQRVPNNLPSLLYAEKIQKLAKKSGFDWPSVDGALEKVIEEIEEVKNADSNHIVEECGDLLFAVVNVLRFYKVEPEMALHEANLKFLRRFEGVEKLVSKTGKDMKDFSLDELDAFWNEVKKNENR